MQHQLDLERPTSERPLYPVRLFEEDNFVAQGDVVKFGGYPFRRTTTGEWCLVDCPLDNDT